MHPGWISTVPVVALGRYVPVFFFEVITGVWLLVKGVRIPASDQPSPRISETR
jgi:hypothetical protein